MNLSEKLEKATGTIDYPMTNDFMFKTVFTDNPFALKGFCSVLLNIPIDDITDIKVTNPILQGETINDKDIILDLRIVLNNSLDLNIEMQVVDEHNWPERSLLYLSRNFDKINKGVNYSELQPAVHAGILNFQLFKDSTEFYSQFRLMNIKTHKLYSSKLAINVLDLTHIENATEEDKQNGLDQWARFFKSKSWEEIKMIAKNNEYIHSAACSFLERNEDEWARLLAEAREDRRIRENDMNKRLKNAEDNSKALSAAITALKAENDTLTVEKETLATENSTLTAENAALLARIKELEANQK